MKVTILGGATLSSKMKVGSAYYVEVKDSQGATRHILIDSGAGHAMPPGPVDLIAITHCHWDHVGNTAYVFYENPNARLLMTRPTVYQTKISWDDSFKIFSRGLEKTRGKERRELANKMDKFLKGLEIASRKESLEIIESPGRYEVFPGIFLTFFPAGHGTRGAAMILVEAEGKRALFTGDISFENTPTVLGARLEEIPINPRIDLLFTDSTHGDKDHPPLAVEEARMVQKVAAALKEGRNIFLASLSFGRLPNVVMALVNAGIPEIYIDGMGRKTFYETIGPDSWWCDHDVQIKYDEEWEWVGDKKKLKHYKIGDSYIRLVDNNKERESLLYSSRPKVISAPSGMLVGGYSVGYARFFLEDPSALFGLTSYQADDAPGRELQKFVIGEKKKGDYIILEDMDERKFHVKVNSQVEHFNISAHASGGQTVKFVKHVDARKTALIHGDTDGRVALKERLEKEEYSNSFVPQNGDEIEV